MIICLPALRLISGTQVEVQIKGFVIRSGATLVELPLVKSTDKKRDDILTEKQNVSKFSVTQIEEV